MHGYLEPLYFGSQRLPALSSPKVTKEQRKQTPYSRTYFWGSRARQLAEGQ